MTKTEVNILLEKMNERVKEITSSKEKSRDFLQEIGIVNKNGKLTKQYEHLCIPVEQA